MIWGWAFRQPSLPPKGLNFCSMDISVYYLCSHYEPLDQVENSKKYNQESDWWPCEMLDQRRRQWDWVDRVTGLVELIGLVQAVTTLGRPWSTCPSGSSAWPGCKPPLPGLSPGLSHLLISQTEWLMLMYRVTRWSTRYSHPDLKPASSWEAINLNSRCCVPLSWSKLILSRLKRLISPFCQISCILSPTVSLIIPTDLTQFHE